MNQFKRGLAALATVGALSAAGSANAAFVMNDWEINFAAPILGLAGATSVGGTSPTSGIDYMGFNDSPIHVVYSDTDGSGGYSVGDRYTVTTKGFISGLFDEATGSVTPFQLNQTALPPGFDGFEITYNGSLTVEVTGGSISAPQWTHVANPADYVDFYIDDLMDGIGSKATPGTGGGYTDGVLIMRFTSVAGEGGAANVVGTFDGSDDVTLILSQLFQTGVFLDFDGNDLVVGETTMHVDSNFDLDSNGNGLLDETRGGFGCTSTSQSVLNFCAVEDGTVRLTSVPAPATLGLLGAGLLGLAAAGRRRKV